MNEYIPHATQPSGIVQDILGFVNEKPKLLLFWIGFIQALYIIFCFCLQILLLFKEEHQTIKFQIRDR